MKLRSGKMLKSRVDTLPKKLEDELEADLGAYILLKNKGREESIKHLLDNFEDRHGVNFNEKLLKRVKNQFS